MGFPVMYREAQGREATGQVNRQCFAASRRTQPTKELILTLRELPGHSEGENFRIPLRLKSRLGHLMDLSLKQSLPSVAAKVRESPVSSGSASGPEHLGISSQAPVL